MNRELAAVAAGYWASIMNQYMIGSDLAVTDLETRQEAEKIFAGVLEETILATNALKIGIHAAENRYTPFLYHRAGEVYAMGETLLATRFGNFLRGIERRSTLEELRKEFKAERELRSKQE